jgi:hypothetical protein
MGLELERIKEMARRFCRSDAVAVGLFGSVARGDCGRYSDVDIVQFVDGGCKAADALSTIVDGLLVVVSCVDARNVDEWFHDPDEATKWIAGLRVVVPVSDPTGFLGTLRERAARFVWNDDMQRRANEKAGNEMVGWAEEAHKGLAGLHDWHTGRLLNARFGLSWGMVDVMRVYRGVLCVGDNHTLPQVLDACGGQWASLCRQAYGISSGAGASSVLSDQVRAGLHLYALTAQQIGADLSASCRPVVEHTVAEIEQAVGLVEDVR